MNIVFFGHIADCLRKLFEERDDEVIHHFTDNRLPPDKDEMLHLLNEAGVLKPSSALPVAISFWYPHRIPIYPGLRQVNLHPSMLPEGRGRWPIPGIIFGDRTSSGVTLHELSAAYDCGDVLFRKEIELLEEDTLDIYLAKVLVNAEALLRIFLQDPERFWKLKQPQLPPTSQLSNVPTSIDLSTGCCQIYRQVSSLGRGATYLDYKGCRYPIDFVSVSLSRNGDYTQQSMLLNHSMSSLSFRLFDGLIVLYIWSAKPGYLY